MKPFRSLTQRVVQWQRTYFSSADSLQSLDRVLQKIVAQVKQRGEALRAWLRSDQSFVRYSNPARHQSRSTRSRGRSQAVLLLIITVLSLTSAIGYRFYNEPQLGADKIAPQTMRAPESARVLDTKTTELNRRAARTAAVPVLMVDQVVNQEIYQSLQRLLDQGEEIRQQAGAFPFVDTSVLSTATQRYLRQAEEWDWRSAIAATEGVSPPVPSSAQPPSAPTNATQFNARANSTNSSIQLAIIELQNYRRSASAEDFSALKEVITRARQRYARALVGLSTLPTDEAGGFYDATLLNLTDPEWLRLRSGVRQVLERVLSQGVPPGLPSSLLENAIKLQLDNQVSTVTTPLASKLLLTLIKPNLVQDPEQTKLRAEQAAQAVENVLVDIRRGEVIVEAGRPITQSEFVLLDHFGLSRRRINWLGLFGLSTLVTGAVFIFLSAERKFHPGLRHRDHLLVGLLTLSTPIIMALNVPAINLPAIGLLVGSFYGSALGVTTVGLLSLLLPMGMELSWTNLIASAIGGLLGAVLAGQRRSREELALLGGAVGVAQGAIYFLLSVMLSSAPPVWYILLTTAAIQSLMGIAWSIVALGLSPYLEHVFDLVTPVRLAELSNPNRPMLKRLASEAPGTFQHTLFVATLAEAAARALGCNVELVRAGTLYHDIGKMHDPLGFIENQMGGPNKHDLIANPQKSAALIKKHVSEGLVMARRCRLPKAVQSFIPEHQGTMLIAYFYHQAQQQALEDPTLVINEADFRYDGPIPQSRETGIVMLADSCEAALRSLKDATPEEALAMVNRILRARWQDKQLAESGLSRTEMSRIAEIFVEVWLQFNHQRIPYPKAVLTPQPASMKPLS